MKETRPPSTGVATTCSALPYALATRDAEPSEGNNADVNLRATRRCFLLYALATRDAIPSAVAEQSVHESRKRRNGKHNYKGANCHTQTAMNNNANVAIER